MLVASSEIGTEVAEKKVEAGKSYINLWREAEKPFSERQKTQGRNGDSIARKYHLASEEKAKLLTEAAATGGVVNPLKNRIGAYWGAVEALILLGANEFHSLKKIRDKMQEVMSVIPKQRRMESGKVVDTDAWTDFYGKAGREGASKPKDGMGRIEQNFKVLQRLPREGRTEKNPYGSKLAQFGMCIDIEYREVQPGIVLPFIRLNTQCVAWTNPDEYPTLVPMYINPNSRRRGAKKKVIQAAVITEDTVVVEAQPSEQQSIEVISSVVQEVAEGILEDSGEKGIVIPPDDFDEQLKSYEAEQAAQASEEQK